MPVPSHETTTLPPPPTPSKWGPYSSAGDFSANMIVILVLLFCALLLVLALNAVVRYVLCRQIRRHSSTAADPEKPPLRNTVPTQIFTADTNLAGMESECAICLGEFATEFVCSPRATMASMWTASRGGQGLRAPARPAGAPARRWWAPWRRCGDYGGGDVLYDLF